MSQQWRNSSLDLIEKLKLEVESHPVLTNHWLVKRKNHLSKRDLSLWLSQEYFVSIAFVNWFLWTTSLTTDINAKIILVQNIWEELGEGNSNLSHVKILTQFLEKLGLVESDLKILPQTEKYLQEMKEITNSNFYSAIGALGPANEYLLKLEYGQMYDSYQKLRKEEKLPEAQFFKVNLEADESHSAKLFRLIKDICNTEEKKKLVTEGNQRALSARMLFYEGLLELDASPIV
jgi:pyrroloquinoline-quinone synthase